MKQPPLFFGNSKWWLLYGLVCIVFFASAIDGNDKMKTIMKARYGVEGVNQLQAWRNLIHDIKSHHLSEAEQVKKINEFFNNKIRFEDDMVHWKQQDYWATPLETLGSGAGDCEDYTIAKYISLQQLGLPIERLRLIYVKAQIGGPSSRIFQAHMVLGYYSQPNATPLILDSLITSIDSADNRNDLHPVFSFNSDGLWVGNEAQRDPTAHLSRWRDLLMRMNQEGF